MFICVNHNQTKCRACTIELFQHAHEVNRRLIDQPFTIEEAVASMSTAGLAMGFDLNETAALVGEAIDMIGVGGD